MGWTIVGATQNVVSGSATLTINKPAGAASGDYAWAAISYWDDLTLTPPSGWTLHTSILQAANGDKLSIFKKALGGSEPSTYSWTLNTADDMAGGILVVRGQDPTTPIDTTGSSSVNASSTSAPAGSVSPTVNGDLLIYFMAASETSGSGVTSITATAPSGYTEQVDQNGNQYQYAYIATKVQATAAGETPAGTLSAARKNRAVAVAMKVLAAPNAPTLNSATAGNAQVALAWSAPGSGPTPAGYKVKYGTSSGSYTTTIDVGNVTSYTVTSLTNGTLYYFIVVAYNAAGDGSNSNELSATPTAGGSPPSAPTLVSLVPGSTQLVASWGSVAGATGYKVRIGTSTGSYGAATSVGNVTSYTFTGLTNGTRYYVIVIATNASGDSGNSNELNAVPSATSRIQTKYNDMAVGDVVFLEKLFTFEAMSVQQHATPDAGKVYKAVTVNGQAGFEFEVTRNLDGTGKNDWLAGDSYVNTGSPGSGFIDQYSYTSVLARPLEFIAIDGAMVDSFAVDLTLLSGSGGIAAFGVSNAKFDALHVTIKTPAIYTSATIVYEYWNGTAWATLSATVSERDASNAVVTADWKTAGFLSAVWTPPADWAQTTIATTSAYWMRVRVSAATGWTQSPKHGGGKWITRGKRQYGPSIAFWRRMSSTWNDLREGGAIGNLEGFYDYGAPAMGAAFGDPTASWLGIDAVNGIRIMRGSTKLGQWDTAGNILVGDTTKGNVYISSAGVLSLRNAGTTVMKFDAPNNAASFEGVVNIGTSGELKQGTGTVGSNFTGIRLFNSGGIGVIAGYNTNVVQWQGGTDGKFYIGDYIRGDFDGLYVYGDYQPGYGTSGSLQVRHAGRIYLGGDTRSSRIYGTLTSNGAGTSYSNKVTLFLPAAGSGGSARTLMLDGPSGLMTWDSDIEASGAVYAGNWLRATAGSGFYIEPFGPGNAYGSGGWYMTDATWLRAYNDKGIYTGGNLQTGGYVGVNTAPDSSNYYRLKVSGGIATMGSNAGVIYASRNGTGDWAIFADNYNITFYMDAAKAWFTTSGTAYKADNTSSWQTTSDARLKTVRGDYTLGLDAICKVRPVEYEWNGNGGMEADGKRRVGIIAQEIREIFPNTVAVGDDAGDIKGLLSFTSDEILWALVNAVKTLSSKVEELEKHP